jgi:hypothetical protein
MDGRDLGQSWWLGAETISLGAYPARTTARPLATRAASFPPANTITASERAGVLVAGSMNSTTEATPMATINPATTRAAARTRRGWRKGGNRVKVLCCSGVAIADMTIPMPAVGTVGISAKFWPPAVAPAATQ